MEKVSPSGKLTNVMGGPHRVPKHPSMPETVLVLELKILYAEKSLSLKQTEMVGHRCPSHSRKALLQGEKLALCGN